MLDKLLAFGCPIRGSAQIRRPHPHRNWLSALGNPFSQPARKGSQHHQRQSNRQMHPDVFAIHDSKSSDAIILTVEVK
jgi:hypothetical protein